MSLFTIASLILAANITQVVAGGFSATCESISYSSTTLSAWCQDSLLANTHTEIDLTRCLANIGGKVVVRHPPQTPFAVPLPTLQVCNNLFSFRWHRIETKIPSPSFKFCDCGLSGDRKILNCQCTDSSGIKRPTSVNLGQ
ncbi:hypothetical protein CT0861_06236 [Colletotrichum tofieldiae]|uniref:Cyanovirin-N domain-containing protein n=1 Tax=Colletotrichum tofieldiae TaxID=708197 RepID=A0A166N7L5_9PEZI|nr:hypothetical protein CT0861_06236 [Colletotrichum tofieldiae]